MEIPDSIDCVDCGQVARRLTPPPEEGWSEGDSVAYRCTACNDRWDLVVGEGGHDAPESPYAAEVRALLDSRRADRPS
jgi:hypothetical protein